MIALLDAVRIHVVCGLVDIDEDWGGARMHDRIRCRDKRKAGHSTSSPGLIPAAMSARCRAVVQDETATASAAPTYSANLRSNSATFGPWVTQPLLRTSTTASSSAAPNAGRLTGIIFVAVRVHHASTTTAAVLLIFCLHRISSMSPCSSGTVSPETEHLLPPFRSRHAAAERCLRSALPDIQAAMLEPVKRRTGRHSSSRLV